MLRTSTLVITLGIGCLVAELAGVAPMFAQQEQGIVDVPPDEPGEIPQNIVNYFDQSDSLKKSMSEKIEIEIERLQIQIRGAVGQEKSRYKFDLANQEKTLEKLKKSTVTPYLRLNPKVGEIGAVRTLTVFAVINDSTVIARFGDQKICVTPIPAKQLKKGHIILGDDLIRVVATSPDQSDLFTNEKILLSIREHGPHAQIQLIAEPVKKSTVEKYRKRYNSEKVEKAKLAADKSGEN